MRKNAKFILIVLITLSLAMGTYDVFLYLNDLEVTPTLNGIWSFVFIILLVLWVNEDSKDFSGIYRPFEYGFLVLIFYIPYIPYYLIKTRGVVLGIVYLFGFLLLFNVGWLSQWLVYWAS